MKGITKGKEETLGVTDMFTILIVVMVSHRCIHVIKLYILKGLVQFIVCPLYLNSSKTQRTKKYMEEKKRDKGLRRVRKKHCLFRDKWRDP